MKQKRGKISRNKKSAQSISGDRKRLVVDRFFTQDGVRPLDQIQYVMANSQIKDKEGRIIFEMKDIEVPAHWSQLAIDILVSKYMRKVGVPGTQHENSIRQVIHRITHALAQSAIELKYFDETSAYIFEDELAYLLIHQMGAFNSPVWFNLGLFQEYGIQGSGGNFAWDLTKDQIIETRNAFEKPQCSACFIQSVDDDLMSIFQLMKNEARLFKYGSGSGTNFSRLRGASESLSGGGTSSGLMSFLEVLDRAAGATKSGGTTRRAAKMVCLDLDHPEVIEFITWKSREERKVAALVEAGYSSDFNGEAYRSVSGQNSNNSVRVTDEFMHALDRNLNWNLYSRTTGEVVATHPAREIWHLIAQSAWVCADPGVQFDTTIQEWHTCKNSGRIDASNPCSEYMFLNDSACNLASLNLVRFLNQAGQFEIEDYRRACQTFILAQEILVDLSSYPTSLIAQNSHDYRPLGLGFANLGALLMQKGIAYDSSEGRSWAAVLTALMTGYAYEFSAEMARVLGPFAKFSENKDSMLTVMGKHQKATESLNSNEVPQVLVGQAQHVWRSVLEKAGQFGLRNAQVSVLAPTGTIGLLMDCDTTGVEPDFSLVKFKKMVGGGYIKIVNHSVPLALKNLGYSQTEVQGMMTYLLGTLSLENSPYVNRTALIAHGLSLEEVHEIEKNLPGLYDLRSAFTRYALGEELLSRVGVSLEEMRQSSFNFLRWIGLDDVQITQANQVICGAMTLEGAPHLRSEHSSVFDCAQPCGAYGKRFISPMGHVQMMSAIQPFLSGAISKTVNLPHETTVSEIQEIYYQAWKLGLKSISVYRDGCKLSQPLSARSESSIESGERSHSTPSPTVQSKERQRSIRRRLPAKRRGFTQEAIIAGHRVYLRTGEYEEGSLGEVFIDMHKEGAAYRSMMNCFSIAVSLGLQYGVPLEEFVDQFTFTRFDPSGVVHGHPHVKMATSVVDYIFRVLGLEYLGRTDFVQVKPVVDIARETHGEKRMTRSDLSRESKNHSSREKNQVDEDSLSEQFTEMMSDAPACDQCGHTTIRSGSCYRCLNCGSSLGCS